MDLTLTPEQEQLQEVLRSLLGKHSGPEQVRAAEASGFDPELWRRLIDLGITGIGVEDAAGGTGGGVLDLGLVAEACGASLASAPFVEAPAAIRAVLAAGSDAGRLIDDEVATFCPRPSRNGVVPVATFGSVASRAVALDGDRLVLAEVVPPGRGPTNLGSRALAPVPLRVEHGATSVEVLAEGERARSVFDATVDAWCTTTAAALTGLANQALTLGVAYVKERHQFGRPIGSFQSVAHRLADVATDVDGADLLWKEAAWAIDVDAPEAHSLARMAFVFASEVAERAALTSLHFHGGYGFMLEYDVQLFARRAKAWPMAFGPRAEAIAGLADALYGEQEAS